MIRYAAHRIRRKVDRILRPGGRGAVLLYHRVAEEASDPYGLCVTPRQFEEHLQVIRELGRPMRLRDFVDAVRGRSLPDRAIAVSFDDGYVDNLEQAKPILARHDVPGLVFVTTGAGGREREFWWDQLDLVFLQPGELPGRLEIAIRGEPRLWDLGPDRVYSAEQQASHQRWHLLDETAPTARHEIFRQVYYLVQPLAAEPRRRILDELLAWAGRDGSAVRPSRRAMRPEQVASLLDGGLVDVGAHTVGHPALPSQPAEVQRAEMAQSRRDLENWCGRPVDGFAYPYGLHDETAVAAARSIGFAYACSGEYRPVRPGVDPFLIPRIEAPIAGGDALAEILSWQLR